MTGTGSRIQLSKSDLIFFLGAAWCASQEQIRSYFLEFCLSLRTRIFSFISTEMARKSKLTTFVMGHLVGKSPSNLFIISSQGFLFQSGVPNTCHFTGITD